MKTNRAKKAFRSAIIAIVVLTESLLFAACGGEGTHSHTYEAWQVVTAADCVTAGTEKSVCALADCGETETRSIPALGHNYQAGVCLRCGADGGGGSAEPFVPVDYEGVVFDAPATLTEQIKSVVNAVREILQSENTTSWRQYYKDQYMSDFALKTKSGTGGNTQLSTVYSDNSASYFSKSPDGNFYRLSGDTAGGAEVSNIYDDAASYLAAVRSSSNFSFEYDRLAYELSGYTSKKGNKDGADIIAVMSPLNTLRYSIEGITYEIQTESTVFIADGKLSKAVESTNTFVVTDGVLSAEPSSSALAEYHTEWNYTGGVGMPVGWESKASAEPGQSFPRAVSVSTDGTETSCVYGGKPVWFKADLTANTLYNYTVSVYGSAGSALSAECTGIKAARHVSATMTDGEDLSSGAELNATMSYTWNFTGYLKITLTGVTDAVVKVTFTPA